MAVKEKLLHGGGLGPVVGEENHLPVEGKVTLSAIVMVASYPGHVVGGTTWPGYEAIVMDNLV